MVVGLVENRDLRQGGGGRGENVDGAREESSGLWVRGIEWRGQRFVGESGAFALERSWLFNKGGGHVCLPLGRDSVLGAVVAAVVEESAGR